MSYVPYVDTYAQAEEGNANNQSGNELAANQHLNIMTSQFEQGQESNQFTDSFTNNSNMTLPQFDQEQGNSSFVDGINVNTPSSRKRPINPTPNQAKHSRFDSLQTSVDYSPHGSYTVTPPFYTQAQMSQTPNHAVHSFPNAFASPPAFHSNGAVQPPFFNAVHSTPLQKFFNPNEQMMENVSIDWLDLRTQLSRIEIVKYVWLPIRQDVNTGGLLLGHNGSTMEKICNTYKCTIKLCGAGSSNNPANEFNLYHSGDPQYQHYNMPLHMIISIKGTPLSAYERFYKLLNMVLCIINMTAPFQLDGIQIP